MELEKQDASKQEDVALAEQKSPGERLVPLLVIAMESCLIYALLLISAALLVNPPGPLLPLWTILLVYVLDHWLAGGLQRHLSGGLLPPALRKILATTLMSCAVLTELIWCAWLRFYAGVLAPLDPAWLEGLTHNPGLVERFFQLMLLAVLLSFLAWISYRTLEKQALASLLLSKGGPLLALLCAIGLLEELLFKSADFWQPPMLLVLFAWLGLLAQALQKATNKRRQHRADLTGGFRGQERIIFQVMSSLGLLALCALAGMLLAHGNLRLDFHWHFPGLPMPTSPARHGKGVPVVINSPRGGSAPATGGFSWSGLLLVLLAVSSCVLLFSLLTIAVRWLLRYRRRRRARGHRRDERRSLWSWSLFFSQWKMLWLPLLNWLGRLLRKTRGHRASQEEASEDELLAPGIHDVRALYRLFLQEAARQGYPRQFTETPQEFQARLDGLEPQLEPELARLTRAYTQTRYGGVSPRADEISSLQESWHVLNARWIEA